MPPRPSSVDVLLVLLDHADPDTLLVLLKPENVRALLHHEGWTDDAIRKALTRDNKHPGELLLGLFELGRTAADLLATLGPDAVAEVAATRAANPARKADAAGDPAAAASSPSAPAVRAAAPLVPAGVGRTRLQTAGLIVVFAAAIAPAMLGVMDLRIALAMLVFGVARTLALIGLVGGLGGALAAAPQRPAWTGFLGGAAAAVGGCAAVVGYVLLNAKMGRDSVMRLEVALLCILGMLPGLGITLLLSRLAAKRPEKA